MYINREARKKRRMPELQKTETYGKIETNQRWLLCPACGKAKVLKLLPGTQVRNLPVYCRQCRKETIVNIPKSLSL